MHWLSAEGVAVMGILLLSAVADILFIIVAYKILLKLFKSTHVGLKVIAFILALALCVPFVVALHRSAIFFLVHHIAYLWLLIMILLCAGLSWGLHVLNRKSR
jgi:hypothetical protein